MHREACRDHYSVQTRAHCNLRPEDTALNYHSQRPKRRAFAVQPAPPIGPAQMGTFYWYPTGGAWFFPTPNRSGSLFMEAAVALQADPTLAQGPWGGTAQSVALGLPPVDTPEENPAPTRPAPHTRAILRGTVLDSNQMVPHLPGRSPTCQFLPIYCQSAR